MTEKRKPSYLDKAVENRMENLGTQKIQKKKREKAFRRISAALGALLSVVLFYTLMKPAITLETNPEHEPPQLICGLAEHTHGPECMGYDHEESDPVYAVSRELDCPFVPHVHGASCRDEAGNLICGLSEEYYHTHDEYCYDHGNLVCTLQENPKPEEAMTEEVRVLSCGREETPGHVHTGACYTTVWFTDEEPICGKEEGGPHIHTEACYGPVLVCDLDHEHTDDCYGTGLICGQEEGEGHIHDLECYPSMRELDCEKEETEGHVHTDDCYVTLLTEKTPHVHSETCWENGKLICGQTEVWEHQHTEACWKEIQVPVSGGHRHNEECTLVPVCGLPEHVHTANCYTGDAKEIEALLSGKADGEGDGAADDEDSILENEDSGAFVSGDDPLIDEEAWADAGFDLIEEETAEENPDPELSASVETDPDAGKEAGSSENEGTAKTGPEIQGDMSEVSEGESADTGSGNGPVIPGENAQTEETEDEEASLEIPDQNGQTETGRDEGAAPEQFDSLHFQKELRKIEDHVYAVELHEDEGVRIEDIFSLEGLTETDAEILTDIAFLEVEDGYFACRFAFEEGKVTIKAGGLEITVLCSYVPSRAEETDTGNNVGEETGDQNEQDPDAAGSEKDASTEDGEENRIQQSDNDGQTAETGAEENETDHSYIRISGEGADLFDAGWEIGNLDEILNAVKTAVSRGDSDVPYGETEDGIGTADAANAEGVAELSADNGEQNAEETSVHVFRAFWLRRNKASEAAENAAEDAQEPVVTGFKVTVPLYVRFSDMIPERTRMTGVDCRLFRVDQETLEVTSVSDFEMESSPEEIRQLIIETADEGCWVLAVRIDYVREEGTEAQGNKEDDEASGENTEAATEQAERTNHIQDSQVDQGHQNSDADLDEQQGESEKTGDHDGGEDLTITLSGDGVEGVKAVEEPENAEAVLEIVKAYLDAQQETAADDSTEASEDAAPKKGSSLLWRVFAVTSEAPFDGSMNVKVPIHADLTSVIPEGASIDLINHRLFLVDPENGEVIPVDSFEVVTEAGTVQELNFTADRTGIWVFSVKAEFTEPETDIHDTADEDETASVEIVLRGDGIEDLKAFFDADHAEAVEEMVNAYLNDQKAASDGQDTESFSEESHQKGTGLFWRVFTIASESEKAYDGNLEVTVPVDVNILEMIPEGTMLASLNCQLFRVDLENSEVMPVGDFEVMSDSESVRSVSFATNVLGTWALVGTVEYAGGEAENQEPADPAVNTGNVDGTDTEKTVHLAIDLTAYRPEEGSESDAENTGNEFEQSASETEKSENETEESENESEEFENKTEESENEAAEESSDSTEEHTEEIPAVEKNESGIALNLAKIFEESAFAEQDGLFAAQYKGILFTLDQIPEETIAFERMQAVSSDDELIYADGKLNINGNGSLEISDGSVSMMIAVTGFEVRNKESAETAEADTEPLNVGIAQITTGDGEGLPVGTEGHAVISEDTSSVDLVKEFLMNQSRRKKMMMAAPRKTAAGSETRYMVFDIEAQAESESGFNVTVDLGENPITGYDFQMYHVHDGMVEPVEVSVSGTVIDEEKGIQEVSQIHFTTGSFSDFVLSYTVDFYWEVNGETFEFSIPGGSFVSFHDLLEILGIKADDEATETDEIQEFLDGIESVEFSNPELVSVSKAEEDTTVGAIKERLQLECVYSDEMTAEQTAAINGQEVRGGDWALISLKPFDTEESLTVIMNNGDMWTVLVTDGQIRKTVMFASGEMYEITVTYDDAAGIPDGSELTVREILPEDKEYEEYYDKAVEKAASTAAEASDEAELMISGENADDIPEEAGHSDASARICKYARIFDIEIWNGDLKIEPASAVTVQIRLMDAPEDSDAVPTVVHFAEEGPEIMDAFTADSTGMEVQFATDSFSVYSVVYTVDFHYEINGKMYDFSIPGGGFVSLEHVVEVLGIGVSDTNASEIAENDAVEAAEYVGEAQGAAGTYDEAIKLNEVEVSEAARKFVADVESVEFSSPELLWVGKVNEEATVGGLKEANRLETEYSADLTEEQIAEINAQTVEAGDWALISMQPFNTEESLTVTMKNGDTFTILVTDGQIKKTVITASGEAWEITVTYGEDAQIPDGAELKVREILPEDEEYEQYYQQSLEKVGVVGLPDAVEETEAEEVTDSAEQQAAEFTVSDDNYAHIFDIQIWNVDNEIQPASAVAVSIKLLDAPESEDTNLQIVHFGKDGLEVMELIGSEEETEKTEKKADGTELNFLTDEFSVYSVIEVTNDNLTAILNNGPYALVTGIANDPGATTGYNESWGRDYFTIIVNAQAMTDTEYNYGLSASNVHAWTDGDQGYVGGSDAELWQFESIGNNQYYIYVLKDGVKHYINQWYYSNALHDQIGLSTQYPTAFTITPNSDGTVLIHSGNWYLHNDGSGEWAGRRYTVSEGGNTTDASYCFRLCKESDAFDSFAAKKVEASAVTTNTNYVIYRKLVDTQGNEALYALAHDGTFVRVYDGGDTIYWRETDKNIYWNYQMDGNYPVLFTQDPVTHEPIYINPNHSTGQTLSTTAAGLTLIGKENGEYSTAIECWDQAAYDYAGLHVTVDNNGTASLSTGTRVTGTSDEFLFAEATSYPGATAETVDTVDSDSLGIKITMYDYGDPNGTYSAGDKLGWMTDITGSDNYSPHHVTSLVQEYLQNGLPVNMSGVAMTGLFPDTADGTNVTYVQKDVNHLFLQSYYDENGTFRYRSEDNYAYLGLDEATDFTVYRQAATPYTTDYAPGHSYYNHGHFMPYNDIDMNNNLSRLMNQYGNAYDPETGEIIGEIPLEDGRTYEDIYGVQGTPNFYTGMKMEANFTQPRDGKLENGDDMVFKFTGDDDMWVYIDGILVLDVGGIHEPLSGTINFATGVVENPDKGNTTLYQIFQTAYNNGHLSAEKWASMTWKDVNGDGTPDTFADYTNHDFKAFYMERGAGASNLDLQFNLKVVLTNQFTVQKEIPEDVDDRFDNQIYRFRATYMDGTTERGLHAGIENVCSAVVYRGTNDPVEVDNDGYFTLRAGEAAVFMMADESIRYNVREVDIDGNLIERVDINGQQVTVTDGTAEAGYAMVEERTQVSVMNHPKTQNLKITKHLTENSAPLVEGENPVFEFRVYLETTVTNEDGTTQQQLVPYSYGPYYLVKKVDGALHYFTLTGVNNAPVDKGTEPVVCSTTGRSGSINSIPPEYTIIIPNLVIGTNFYVEERRDNIPEGYEYVREELTPNTYDESTLIGEGASAEVIDRVLARDEADHQEFDPSTVGQIKSDVDAESHVFNRKPAVIITVEKEWDPDPESGTTVTVELRRYAKITKGTISVTLYDNNEAPIEGAEFELYKNGAATGTKVTTNVNGIASISGLEAGTYKLVQTSTPDGYSMDGHTTETGTLTVVDNVTAPQTLSESLTNTALVTAGKVTLTLTDSGAGSGTAGTPIEGAAFTLYKDGSAFKTGCVTNSEGKVIVGNLDAGEYYFVQTGTASDYYLPNVTRTEYFTVVENPGVTQEFNQSMANSLKGKGTVSLSLTKDSGDVISGASFQLKSGNTVLETKQTASDGTLSFSSELYEGTYTVHQVNTGSAGDDYATAGDQNVTIEANSMTTQQKSLTFVNEEASIIYTLTIRSSSDNLSVSYNYRKNTDVTLTFDNGNDHYDPYEGVVLSGDVNGTISGHSSSFSVTMDSDKTITLTSTGNSNWSNVVTNALQVSPLPETRSRANSNPSRTVSSNSMDFRTLSAPMLRSTSGATRSVIHTNASPAAAPAGYAEDSTFEAIEITLPTADGWQYTFPVQDKFDANGDPYYYYIVETACSDPDYWIDSYTGGTDGLLNDDGTLKVKNVKEKTGSIQVMKSFSGVENLPEGFQISNSYNSEIFTVANASGSGTTADPYVWTLSEIPGGTTVSFTESGATVSGYNLTVTSSGTVTDDSTVAATVVAGDTVTADLVNTYELKTTEITLKKVDKNDLNETNATLLKGAAFTLSKYESDSYQSKDLSWGTNGSKNLSDDKNPDGTYTLNGVFTFDGLTAGYYKIEETSFPAGYVKLSSDPTFKVEANASNELIITILNNPDNLLKLVDGEMTIVVGNTPGVAFPNTGGPGTRLFTILGSILILGAGVLLWRRRRTI